ncbi:hypothetical protein V4D09_02495 [Vibrio mimicus]|uniref:hypothetical protein n=1 Tax=Vibrio mimicus TaxID=674 RepID=UPI002F94FC76
MAQQHSNPTRTNLKLSDQRFAAGHESSPKNDVSSPRQQRNLKILARLRQIHGLDANPKSPAKTRYYALNYICTLEGCVDLNGRLAIFTAADRS